MGRKCVLLSQCPLQILYELLCKKTPASVTNSKWLAFGLDNGEIVPRFPLGIRDFMSSKEPRFRNSPSLITSGEAGAHSSSVRRRIVDLVTWLHAVSRSRISVVVHPLPRTPSWRWPLIFHHDTKLQDILNDVCKQVRRLLYWRTNLLRWTDLDWQAIHTYFHAYLPLTVNVGGSKICCSSWTTASSWKEIFCYCSRVMTVLHNSLGS